MPSPYALLRVLQVLFEVQARDVLSRLDLQSVLETEQLPDTSAWVRAVANATRPLLRGFWHQGMLRQRRRFLDRQQRKALGVAFDLFNPRVLEVVDTAVLEFCEETNATATVELAEALAAVRRRFREGLPRGDALQSLATSVREIFADPYRAFRIAATETSRFLHGGQLLAMQENPAVRKKQWLASADACDDCLELDGEQRNLDEPFVVLPGRGPYRIVQAPPLHPHCFCDLTEVL